MPLQGTRYDNAYSTDTNGIDTNRVELSALYAFHLQSVYCEHYCPNGRYERCHLALSPDGASQLADLLQRGSRPSVSAVPLDSAQQICPYPYLHPYPYPYLFPYPYLCQVGRGLLAPSPERVPRWRLRL